jgi:hypothetical protein
MGSQQQRSCVGRDQPGIECRFHTAIYVAELTVDDAAVTAQAKAQLGYKGKARSRTLVVKMALLLNGLETCSNSARARTFVPAPGSSTWASTTSETNCVGPNRGSGWSVAARASTFSIGSACA